MTGTEGAGGAPVTWTSADGDVAELPPWEAVTVTL